MKEFANELYFNSEEEFSESVESFSKNTSWRIEKISESSVSTEREDGSRILCSGEKRYCLNEYGASSLPLRAGLQGSVLSELNNSDWANVLNTCFPYKEGNMILNELEGEVFAAHSDNYAIIPIDEIVSSSKEILHSIFPNIKFVGGVVAPQLTVSDYSLIDEEKVMKAYQAALNISFDRSSQLLYPSIRISTSNTGDSGVNIFPTLTCKNSSGSKYVVMAGSPLKMEHKGNASIIKFRENLEMSMSMVEKSTEKIIALTYVMINNPVNCFLNIAQRLCLPKNTCMEIADDIDALLGDSKKTHGRFIYLSMIKILEKSTNLSQKAQFELANNIGRMLSIDITKYDTKCCEWLSTRKNSTMAGQIKLDF